MSTTTKFSANHSAIAAGNQLSMGRE
jgi:hypothetical protein